jgi:RNA polymerase sigma-70 factor (ECF subfamily)
MDGHTRPEVVSAGRTLEELIDLHGRELHAYLWRLLGDGDEAEDGLQETFLRALRGLPRLRHPDRARAWLYQIATHVAFTELRRRNRRQDALQPLDDELVSGDSGPEAAEEAGADLQELRRAVEALPARQRAALMMRKYQAMTYDEVGVALGCSPQTARAHVYQALRKVRTRFLSRAATHKEAA